MNAAGHMHADGLAGLGFDLPQEVDRVGLKERHVGIGVERMKIAFLRTRKHRGMDGRGASKECRSEVPLGTNVLTIKYKSGDPNQASLIANAFLAATIDGSVAMKAAEADQTARWFSPQLDELRKELDDARAALRAFQTKANMVRAD